MDGRLMTRKRRAEGEGRKGLGWTDGTEFLVVQKRIGDPGSDARHRSKNYG